MPGSSAGAILSENNTPIAVAASATAMIPPAMAFTFFERRIFESLGYRVLKLDRVMFCGLTKKGLKRGDWRFLTQQEVAMLHMGSFE